MKRIDEKIKEIEKKDKKNRILFFVIIVLIGAFLVTISVTKKKIDSQAILIDSLKIKETKTYKILEGKNLRNLELVDSLKNSLKPEQYWDHVLDENTVEGYINFVTNDFKIDKSEYLQLAIDKLTSEDENKPKGLPEELGGWLFVGTKNTAGAYTNGNSSGTKTIQIIYRLDKETKTNKIDSFPELADSEPKIGDIVRLVGSRNRVTYTYKSRVGDKSNGGIYMQQLGFRNQTKAVVVDKHADGNSAEFYVNLRYY